MGDIIRLSDDPHTEIQSLLPWYANGTLSEEEAIAVEAHLAECPECRDDLVAERAIGSEISGIVMDVEKSWAAMRRRIEQPVPEGNETVVPFRPKSVLRRSVPMAWAVAAQAAALVLVVGGVWLAQPATQPAYHALGAAPAPAAANMVVIFRPDATEQQMRTLLTRNHASLVDGPTPSNAYLLHVAAARRAATLADLGASKEVVLAEPVDGPARP